MKSLPLLSYLLLPLVLLSLSFMACESASDTAELNLSEREISDLQFMVEEEQLARDVYQHFYDQYGTNIFGNIAESEQRHMDAIEELLDYYGVENPSTGVAGQFSTTALQDLYQSFIQYGEASLSDALTVGATIEDLDIRDLFVATAGTNKERIYTVYESLRCASRNHLRAFSGRLSDQGVSYTPQYITPEAYTEIINGSHEQCGN